MKTMSVKDLKEWLDSGRDFELIDVREPYEYEICHIAEAKLEPLMSFQSKINNLDKSKTYAIVCKVGGRSGAAVDWMTQAGFDNAINVLGGMDAWVKDVDPSMPSY